MKTKKSKRLLAAFLAAIMVLTTFAAMPFSSFAAEHSAEDLKNLLDQYETRIESGTPYTNLASSYEAWYNGYVTYFLVTAGVRTADEIDTAYKNLETQFNAMQVWTPYKATATQAADGSYTSLGLVDGDQMSNVLYSYGVGVSSPYADVRTDDGGAATETRAGVQYGTAVLMYDGTDTPLAFPVSMYTARYTNLATSGTRSMRPTTSPFALVKNWHGFSNTPGYQTATESYVGYIDNSDFLSNINASNNSPDRYSNTLYWTGDSSTFGDEYVLHYPTQEWITYNEDRNSGTFNQTSDIYVINYNAVIEAVNSIPNDLCDYSYSLVSSYLKAIEMAMAVNPQSYIKGSDIAAEVESCTKAISSAVSEVESARKALTTKANMDSYIQLANNYAAYTPIINNNNQDGYYSATSYTIFERNYGLATSTINYIANKTYRFSDATSTNTNLVNAYNGLVTSGDYIKDTELQACFQQYYSLTQGYYKAETYSALTDKINAALKYYNNGSYTSGITLRETEENIEIYNTILNDVKTAMAGLRLSHDAVVPVLGTQLSYNSAMAYAQGIDGYKFSNYTDVMDKVAEATRTMTSLDKTDFTDQATVISKYTELITNIANALLELKTAFTGLTDGTVVSQTTGTTNGYTADNVKTYLSGQITNITYFKTVSGNSSYVTEYDISVNNHWSSWASSRGVQFHSLGFGAFSQDTVDYGNGKMSVRWKEGGASIEGNSGAYSSYHALLMKPTSSVSSGNDYVNIPAASDGTRILGETTVSVGDLGISSVSFTTPDLVEYFGVNAGGWDGFQTRTRTNSDVKQTVTVIDISDLVELVSQAADIVAKYQNNAFNCYTSGTWNPFSDALAAAQADLNYSSMTNEAIVSEVKNRYDTLQTAMSKLQENTSLEAHNFIEQSDSQHATCEADGNLHYVCSVCGYDYQSKETALGHDIHYTPNNDGATHTKTCSRGDVNEIVACEDSDGNMYCDSCGQALYEQADWTQFNAAKAEMEELLAAAEDNSMKFTSAALEDANLNIVEIRFYNYTAQEQATVPDTQQEAVNQQTQRIVSAVEALRNGQTDESVYEANLYKVSTLNADAYNVSVVQNAVQGINVETPVEVNGKIYTGYDYDNYNTTLGNVLSENWYEYYICVYDINYNMYWLINNGDGTYKYSEANADMPETGFHYGETITLENPSSADEICRWATIAYTDNSSDYEMGGTPKYQTTAASYTFSVRGNMDIYTTAAAAEDDSLNEIRFVLAYDGVSTGNVLDVQYAPNGVSMINSMFVNIQHNIPFHKFSSYLYEDGSQVLQNNRLNVNGDMIVLVNYETTSQDSFTVNLYNENGEDPIYSTYPLYNEKVVLSDDNAVAYINADNGKVLCYGSEYTFYAYQDVNVKAVTSIDEQTASVDVIKAPIVDGNGKVYIFGNFALPEGATIKSYGIVLNAGDQNDTDLSLADLNKGSYIYNLTSSNYTCQGQNGNQFGISFSSSSMYPKASYVAYAIYEGADGNEYYAYSDVITQASIYA